MLVTLKRSQEKMQLRKCAILKSQFYDLSILLELQTNKCTVTILKPQMVPSAAGMNLVSHLWPTRWHQSDLQISWKEGGKKGGGKTDNTHKKANSQSFGV